MVRFVWEGHLYDQNQLFGKILVRHSLDKLDFYDFSFRYRIRYCTSKPANAWHPLESVEVKLFNQYTSAAVPYISDEKLQGNQDHYVVTLLDQKVRFLVRFWLDIGFKSS